MFSFSNNKIGEDVNERLVELQQNEDQPDKHSNNENSPLLMQLTPSPVPVMALTPSPAPTMQGDHLDAHMTNNYTNGSPTDFTETGELSELKSEVSV